MLPIYKFLAMLVLLLLTINGFCQPRVIKGTVYNKEGKKAAGVMVTADKSKGKYFTSFDGFYEISANIKSKWIKFTFPDRVEKLNIVGITRDVIDFGEDREWNKSDTTQRNKADKDVRNYNLPRK
jgi:hypothetical protein